MARKAFPASQEILRDLSDAFGPSGHEEDVREYITALIRPLVDEMHIDALGNLIAFRKGKGKRKLMLDAHMDEVGIMVRYIDDHGFLRFAKLGGWDDRIFAGHRVKLRARDGHFYYGIIGMSPPHVLSDDAKNKTIKAEDYFIDMGAHSLEEALALGANIGDAGVIDYSFMEFAPGHFVGKAFDDRAGCLLLIQALKAMAEGTIKTPMNVYASFSTSEELGMRGAKVSAYAIDPDVAIVLEGTIGSDFPGVAPERRPCSQRKGPVISMIDNSILVPRRMSQYMFDCADKAGVPYQIKMPIYGGTDAGAIHQSRGGILCGIISVPCRYIHSPNGSLYWPDYEQSEKLLLEVLKRVHTLVE